MIDSLIDDNGGTNNIFQRFKNRPSKESAISMFMSGKFGIEHPFRFSGMEFALEYAFDEFNEVFSLIQTLDNWHEKTQVIDEWNLFVRAQDEPWANLIFSIWVDKSFAPFVTNLSRDEFVRFTERDEELIHEQTKSIVFDVKFMGKINKDHHIIKGVSVPINFSEVETKGKPIYHYGIWIASADLYEKFSTIKNKSRKQYLDSAQAPLDGHNDYIVYIARDKEGTYRYIGEGRPERHLHVNSGASHNYKINEHYFLNGALDVDVVSSGLSKPKALAIEKFLIVKHRDSLWNIRDNPNARL